MINSETVLVFAKVCCFLLISSAIGEAFQLNPWVSVWVFVHCLQVGTVCVVLS